MSSRGDAAAVSLNGAVSDDRRDGLRGGRRHGGGNRSISEIPAYTKPRGPQSYGARPLGYPTRSPITRSSVVAYTAEMDNLSRGARSRVSSAGCESRAIIRKGEGT